MERESVIELTTPEVIPDITYIKICACKWEVPREDMGKPGYLTVWMSKCYLLDGNYIESNIPGIEYTIEGPDFIELMEIATTIKPIIADTTEIVGQFLVDKGVIVGTVIPWQEQ